MCGKLFLFLSLDLDWAEVDSREALEYYRTPNLKTNLEQKP